MRQPSLHRGPWAGPTGWTTESAPGINSIACGSHLGHAASGRGQSNQMLSEVLRAGRESTAGLSPLSTPDSFLMHYLQLNGRRTADHPLLLLASPVLVRYSPGITRARQLRCLIRVVLPFLLW